MLHVPLNFIGPESVTTVSGTQVQETEGTKGPTVSTVREESTRKVYLRWREKLGRDIRLPPPVGGNWSSWNELNELEWEGRTFYLTWSTTDIIEGRGRLLVVRVKTVVVRRWPEEDPSGQWSDTSPLSQDHHLQITVHRRRWTLGWRETC